MNRITNKQLESMVDYLNKITGNPTQPYSKVGEKYQAQIGNFNISGAYGGVALHQIMNEGGGVTDVFNCGHMPKRELYNRISAYIKGIDVGKGKHSC